ncbi:MAG: hypothetical protein IJ968_05780, partial [Clostridia bacterium]|nr:hypothetical protein [Clostridia bacterium]
VFKVRCPLFAALWDRSAARLIIISPSFSIVNTFFRKIFRFFSSFYTKNGCFYNILWLGFPQVPNIMWKNNFAKK